MKVLIHLVPCKKLILLTGMITVNLLCTLLYVCVWLCFMFVYGYIVRLCMATLTEVFLCFFLSCKANARVKPAKTGHGSHSSLFLCCCMYCLFCVILCIVCVCICVLYYCHWVTTQLQLNTSYHIVSYSKYLLVGKY